MREIVLGTAGHVDHGKTTLVKALTGIETDRLKEEKKRGITIELGFAFLDLPCGHRLGIIDVPGHEKFIKNMVAGAAGLDLVAFVVAADEGVMPQTREHLEICSLLGVARGIIVITKVDMVDDEWLELVKDDISEYFKESFLAEAPVITVSATTGTGIAELKEQLNKEVERSDFTEATGPFRMPVDRSFSMKGFGAVVTGTSISGRLKVGDDICIYPAERLAKVRGIQVHGQDAVEVEAGRRTAINIQGQDLEEVEKGDILAAIDSLSPSYMLDCDFLYLASNRKKLKNRTRVRVHIGTAEIMGRVVLLADEEALPGSQCMVQILLEKPIAAWPGDRYVVRSYSPVRTIGGGVIYNACPGAKRRRFKEVNQTIFELYKEGSPEDLALFHITEGGFAGLTIKELAVRMGIFAKRLKKIINGPVSARKIIVVDSEKQRFIGERVFLQLSSAGKEIITRFHAENPMLEGISKEELRSRLYGGIDQKLFQVVLNGLVKEAAVVQENAIVRLAEHQVSLQADEAVVKKEMEAYFQEKALKPPTFKELLDHFSEYSTQVVKEVLGLLTRDDVLLKVTEELYYHNLPLADLQEELAAFLEKEGEIDAQGFKGMTGLSRKFSIPLLEYFDRIKLTIRVADKRVLRGGKGNR